MKKDKINIVISAPDKGIGGGNRKYGIWYRNLDSKYFNKCFVYIDEESKGIKKDKSGNYRIKKNDLSQFIKSKDIDFFYPGKLNQESCEIIKSQTHLLSNVVFTRKLTEDPRVSNLIISKTEFVRISQLYKENANSHVVYNPIDFKLWKDLKKSSPASYRKFFEKKGIKTIIGRIARSEPSKWDYLIIRTIQILQRKKKYEYGFIFVGMPLLHRYFLKIILSKKMLSNILFLPEMSDLHDIASFYKSIDVFWQTSELGETFGNVIAESFCFNIPVISDYKKSIRKKKILKYIGDSQIELVDHEKNGAYCIYPSSVISFLDSKSKKDLKSLGENGSEKVKTLYDAKIGAKTMAKIFYNILRKEKRISKLQKFEDLKILPSKKESREYISEYWKRAQIALEANKVGFFEHTNYKIRETLWKGLEKGYLLLRKSLKYINIKLEKY
ncbi:glycosyltransferase [Candidatus Woesearchaeota archaeon]|jgi:glycosyltransferase involved in cell wall biosynthesis|nr:glycosyltransferase [Candidatus Woesearchaeota archaeon]MBT3538428.1 glycosyltransferase [Candidatus Woesearchaeota archaeon]MBT4696878.1 glycosyltransferase [Candidatus Woesearchaeota archaeon]MBT7106116.1 glycosyltransferase [Candidatus Woesearchaeota archaeon]MBT7930986.1 glycosyltransferase [Candidatus Woesearchaeota archaeon]